MGGRPLADFLGGVQLGHVKEGTIVMVLLLVCLWIQVNSHAILGRRCSVPVLETADVLNVLGIPGQEGDGGAGSLARSWERPAEVLFCRAQDVRVGA